MKCNGCGKKISLFKFFNPFSRTYRVVSINNDGKKVESFYVCEECGEFYENISLLEKFYGTEKVLELLKEMAGRKEDEND